MAILLTPLLFLSSASHAQKTLGHGARFRAVCIVQMAQLQPEDLAQLPSSPANFCDCVNKRHERYAAETFATQSEVVAYMSNVLKLYEPLTTAAYDRVATEYRDEALNDRGIKRICSSK